jgi:phospholipid/cholesterol/gamma-HCH transport system ATP-binding protein
VLKGISTIFDTGTTNLIIGQSGSGKTVLLKSLLGIHTPDKGTISFDGRIYSNLTPDEKRALRTEIGMVFQGSALFDSMTVEENVGFPLKLIHYKSPTYKLIQNPFKFKVSNHLLVYLRSKPGRFRYKPTTLQTAFTDLKKSNKILKHEKTYSIYIVNYQCYSLRSEN